MIPRNTSSLLSKIAGATASKKPVAVVKKEVIPEEESKGSGGVDSGREAAKLRQRAKKAEADLLAVTTERDALKIEADALRPLAKKWSDYEHIEKSKLIDSLPPELKKDAKDMALHHLRMFAKGNSVSTEKATEAKKSTDSNDIMELQKTGDKKAISDYIAKVKSGEIIPANPVKTEAIAA